MRNLTSEGQVPMMCGESKVNGKATAGPRHGGQAFDSVCRKKRGKLLSG